MPTKAVIRKKHVRSELSLNPFERVIIANIRPCVDNGQFPVKRCVSDRVQVEVDIFAEGQDEIAGSLEYRHESAQSWHHLPLQFIENDQWCAEFSVEQLGNYFFIVKAWIDDYTSWFNKFCKREDNKDIAVDLLIGLQLIKNARKNADEQVQKIFDDFLHRIKKHHNRENLFELLQDPDLIKLMYCFGQRLHVAQSQSLQIVVEPILARFGAWYEIFPRSTIAGKHDYGNFKGMIEKLHYIKNLGFSVVYLPPIHPIGITNRKGKNNTLQAEYNDPGSPWAIGNSSGGHMAVHPGLGSLQDFKELVLQAREIGLQIALDFALQCSPDHPYLNEHPEWFKIRPDGRLQYAENPPKKYQDIYPLNFASNEWYSLWRECKKILQFWIKQGVKIFRVDNPHTKPFIFWQWLILEIKQKHPEVIFLAEAFTRPKIMYHLAKIGFSQSYTYFTWRNTKQELTEYFEEICSEPICEFFRPNLWPNTPDILHEYLQSGKEPAFIVRFILAATLGSSYGIYGPAYELSIHTPLKKGSEEYLNSEKYEIKHWDSPEHTKLHSVIKKINTIRYDNPALHSMCNLKFYHTDNPQIICYSKHTPDCKNIMLIVVNLDYHHMQSGWVDISAQEFGITEDDYIVKDLLSDEEFSWRGTRNYVELSPDKIPAHVFLVKK